MSELNLEDKLRVITSDMSLGGGASKVLSNGRGDMVASDRCVLDVNTCAVVPPPVLNDIIWVHYWK